MSKVLHLLFAAMLRLSALPFMAAMATVLFSVMQLDRLVYDASADTLVAENDPALAVYERATALFGSDETVIVTFSPREGTLFSPETIRKLADLQGRFAEIEGVTAVASMLDAPLLKSPLVPIDSLADGIRTLRSPDIDLGLARQELSTSPLFRDLLVSADGETTALQLTLEAETALPALRQKRAELGPDDLAAYRDLSRQIDLARRASIADRARLMADIRAVTESHSDDAVMYLSGLPMIGSDMIRYVRSDVAMFGTISLILVMATLALFFRQLPWIILPIITAMASVIVTAGLLAWLHQPITVVSSNFVALLIIFSVAFSLHLIVRYRELQRQDPEKRRRTLLAESLAGKFAPCVYTALTTMAGFASLTVSGIVPVADFGWIMCLAMIVTFTLNFTMFPAMVQLWPVRPRPPRRQDRPLIAGVFSAVARRAPAVVLALSIGATVVAGVGLSRLSMDSRFIDYFRPGSDIREGLVYIDRNLGGTTPMDILLSFAPFEPEPVATDDDFFVDAPDPYPERYWYTTDKIERLARLETFLMEQPSIGKVISIATLEKVGRGLNDDAPLNALQLAGIVGAMPPDLRTELLYPYSDPHEGLMRVSVRIRETSPSGTRDGLIANIERFTVEELGFEPDEVEITGVNVLFNNMLRMLFDSQLSTIGLVIAATLLMFLLLLRSPLLAVIGVLPNLLSAALVLGFMGLRNIPLDMMTMTIAAVVVGIGVDNAIHYLHRFKTERRLGASVSDAIAASHGSVGMALYATAIAIIIGFSVLSLSNFVPTVYFGLLTALAMAFSLLVNLVILPSLLMLVLRDVRSPQQAATVAPPTAIPAPVIPMTQIDTLHAGPAFVLGVRTEDAQPTALMWKWTEGPEAAKGWQGIPALFHRQILRALSDQPEGVNDLLHRYGYGDIAEGR